METNKTARELALEWWGNLSISKKSIIGTSTASLRNYDGRTWQNFTGREIEEIWRKEMTDNAVITIEDDLPSNITDFNEIMYGKPYQKQFKQFDKEPDIFNLENKAKFSVKELKEFSEDFAKRVLDRGDKSDLTGFWSLCKEKFYDKFKRKSYITKVEFDESLFQAYINKFNDEDLEKAKRLIEAKQILKDLNKYYVE